MARIPGTLMYVRPVSLSIMLAVGLIVGIALGPSAALANDGQGMIMGYGNTSESTTSITRTGTSGSGGAALQVSGGTNWPGIVGTSAVGAGVSGSTGSRSDVHAGVEGYGFQGVWGEGELTGVVGMNWGDGTGVLGEAHANHFPAVEGFNVGSGVGVLGHSYGGGDGVDGLAVSPTASGVFGNNTGNGPGVKGQNLANGNGVFGFANNPSASGVYGQNDGGGFGVAGRANVGVGLYGDSDNGTGVLANSGSGTALLVQGKMTTSRSGIKTVLAGQASVMIPLGHTTASSFVLATVQGPPAGVWVVSVQVTTTGRAPYLTIYLNAAPAVDVKVGWFALN
jgi:hypothetical protein